MPGTSLTIHSEIFAKILFRGKFHENKTIRNDEIILSLLMLVNHAFVANILVYTTLTNFSTKHLVMCKVYTDVGGIK